MCVWRWRKKFISKGSLKTFSPCCRNSVIQQPRDRRGRTEPPRVGAGPAGMEEAREHESCLRAHFEDEESFFSL